ncbi:uncharacterized protein LOC129573251 isoform X2 [Sitodiplosis mosellana]|nr:uncharacterized protein LOC129573251 isoform X2 [Sitodiplosis mosellana]XP_055309597.1 uncharacterized protein LOC129573251 isoform X2 [Sitodiplosis mosellana]
MLVNCEYSENEGCYHFNNSTDSSVVRGCIAKLEDTSLCKSNGENCKVCMENRCNLRENFVRCNTNSQIVGETIIGSDAKTCEEYNDKCFLHITEDSVTRGCLLEYVKANNLTDTSYENQFDPALFRTCSTTMCNGNVIETESCISCDSEDPSCRSNASSKMSKKCKLSPELMGCYHYEQNDEIKRGCISEIEDDHFRKSCESNSDQCKKCIGNECNSRQTGFQRCVITSDDFTRQKTNSLMFDSKICSDYMDECYTHVADNSVQRGCLSDGAELSIDGVDILSDCKDPDICEKCSGAANCNNKEILNEFCTVCNSESHPFCKEAPNHLMRARCPLSIRPFGCYMYKNGIDFVGRDCMSTDSQLRKWCKTESDSCKYCFGDECNKKRYFEQCHYCNSNQDGVNCKTKPWAIPLKTCKHYMDECYTHVNDDGVVTRGCFSEFESDNDNCTDKDTCLRCTGENACNDTPIKTESCISCDSSKNPNCRWNVTLENAKVCPQKTIRPLGCFHFINESDEYTKRGCVSSLNTNDRSFASKQPNQWKYCHGRDNCNSRSTFTKCFSCNSTVDSDCISNPTLSGSSVKLCNDYDDSCFSHIGSQTLVRGCLNDLGWKSIAKCRAFPEKCDICKGENGEICNDKRFSEAKCISCDSWKDKRCRNKPEFSGQKLCSLANSPDEDLGCYMIRDSNYRVRRGCASDLSIHHREMCWNKSDQCRICNGNNCNKKVEFQHCFVCTSKDDPNCVHSHPSDASTICPNYMDQCLTAIDSEGFTVRKCFSNGTDEVAILKQFSMHELCEENNCNGVLYPEERRQCFQCNGDSACDSLRTSVNKSLEELPCRLYSKYDGCFTFMDEDQNMHRGCMTDSKDSRLLCEKNQERCAICGENGCNDRPLFVEPELSCFKCRDSIDCAYGQIGQEKLVECTMPVRFGTEESCYIRSHIDGTIERGCTLDITDADPNWCDELEDCDECTDGGCNSENVYFGYCLQCDSLNDENCANPIFGFHEFFLKCTPIRYDEFEENDSYNQNNTATQTYTYDPYPFSKRGCYALIQDGVIERGCISDMTDHEHNGCKGATWCNICETDYCNDMPFKSSASIQFASYSLFVALFNLTIFYS